MRFYRRPGFFAASALAVLLFLSWARLLPADAFFSWITRIAVTPIFRAVRPEGAAERENHALRALAKECIGDRSLESFRTRVADEERDALAWTTAHGLPPPLMASVLASVHEKGSQFFLLNRGARDGALPFAAVISGKGFLLGRIVRVREATSFLELVTARGQRFSVMQENGDAPIGITEGRGGSAAVAVDFIPRDTRIAPNDRIVTTGLDDGVPRGLLVGVMRDASPPDNSAWQRATLDPFVRGGALATVGVLALPYTP